MTEANFDMLLVPDPMTWFDGFSNNKAGNDYRKMELKKVNGQTRLCFLTGYTMFGESWSPVKNIYIMGSAIGSIIVDVTSTGPGDDSIYTYQGTKYLNHVIGDTKEFVVSRSRKAFPENGEQDGYWYKLFGQADSVQTLALAPQLFNEVKDLSLEEIRMEVNENGKM